MKIKKYIFMFFILFSFFPHFIMPSFYSALEIPQLILEPDLENIKPENSFSVGVKLQNCKSNTINSIDMKLKFNDKKIIFAGITKNESYCLCNTNYELNGNEILLYIRDLGEINISENILFLNFTSKECKKYGSSLININSCEAYDKSKEKLDIKCQKSVSLNFVPHDVSELTLLNINPSSGTLCPQFSPEIYNYTLDVSDKTKEIFFETNPKNPYFHVDISRKKLNAPGKTTDIKITLKDESKKLGNFKIIYSIKVHRNNAKIISTNKTIESKKSNNLPQKSSAETKTKSNEYFENKTNIYLDDENSEKSHDDEQENQDIENEDNSDDLNQNEYLNQDNEYENSQNIEDPPLKGHLPNKTESFNLKKPYNLILTLLTSSLMTLTLFFYSFYKLKLSLKNDISFKQNYN